MRIAELEARTGINRHTLRYYEKEGLLQEVVRRDNNYRDYPEKAVERVIMVGQLKALGFSLREIRDVLDALRTDSIDCEQGAVLMAEKKALVDSKVRELKKVSALLGREQQRLEASARAQCEKNASGHAKRSSNAV
ncbi:MerR family transcriptional regulator [Alcanivorax hongdengensis A-11-3]|uniref:MerR family transcriptional regulator n=1 Tax=Alcanivorax hongdengensis A-11-3 TaxID=1177179 RepID=L0W8X0_9GAMM|nr:MerR family transcriptional regulator [Alcanivorax hongdengensis]EKF73183.1 MerR family transcriptional regulator [Alcanivorax hongdengensis A-11-3]